MNAPLPLLPHPTSPFIPVLLTVAVQLEPHELVLHYRIRGQTDAVRWPAPSGGGPADGLWQHTCLEAFIASEGQPAYREFNFSPSGRWAHFAFRAERVRAGDPVSASAPLIERRDGPDGIDLIAVLDRSALPPGPWRLGLSAVIEDLHGRCAHWALRHPKDKPDFHDPAGWTLRLPAA